MSIPTGVVFPQQPLVDAVDSNGLRVTAATGDVVATLIQGTGTLVGTVTKPLVAGRATFTDLAIALPLGATVPVTHRLQFSRPGLSDVQSGDIVIRPADVVTPPAPAPTATRLTFVSVPTAVNENVLLSSVLVQAESNLGLLATGYTGVITLAITSVTYITSNIRDIVLTATSPGLASAVSPTIRVTLP